MAAIWASPEVCSKLTRLEIFDFLNNLWVQKRGTGTNACVNNWPEKGSYSNSNDEAVVDQLFLTPNKFVLNFLNRKPQGKEHSFVMCCKKCTAKGTWAMAKKLRAKTVLKTRLQAQSWRTQPMTSIKMSECHKRTFNDSLRPPSSRLRGHYNAIKRPREDAIMWQRNNDGQTAPS